MEVCTTTTRPIDELAANISSTISHGNKRPLLGHKSRCFDCAFQTKKAGNDQENMIASASEDCTVRIWKVSNTSAKLSQTISGHNGEVMRISWSPPSLANGSLLVSGCADGGARIFSPKKENNNLSSENGQPVYDSKPVHLIEHGDRNEVYASFFTDGNGSPHGPTLLTASHDQIHSWDLNRLLSSSPASSTDVSSPLSISLKLNTVKYEAMSGAPVFGGERNQDNSAFVFDASVCTSPLAPHSLLAAALSDGSARISEMDSDTSCVANLHCDGFGTLTAVNWSQNGLTMATSCGDGSILLWDTRMWRCRSILGGAHSRSCFGSLFHPTYNDLLLSWSSDGTISCWDTKENNSEDTSGSEQPHPLALCTLPPDASMSQSITATTNSSPSFPVFRCGMDSSGSQLAIVGGGDGKNSFLGTPVWIYDIPSISM